LHFDDVTTVNCALCDCSSHIPDEKSVSDKKFESDHQMFSTGGCGRLGTKLLSYRGDFNG